MCIPSGSSSAPPPPPLPRWLQDTSQEVIVSKYELSEDNKRRNAQRRLARRKLLEQSVQPSYQDNNDEDPPRKGTPFPSKTVQKTQEESGLKALASNETNKGGLDSYQSVTLG